MAKTRAQRKAERRRRQQAEERRRQSDPSAVAEEQAQEDTRAGVSGEVAEAEAAIETGARVDEFGERVVEKPGEVPDLEDAGGSPVPGVIPEPVRTETATEPQAPPPPREGGAAEGPRPRTAEGSGREGRAPARPGHRIPAFLLGRAQEG